VAQAGAAGAAAACAPAAGGGGGGGGGGSNGLAPATVRVAAWDGNDLLAYQAAAAALTEREPNVKVEIELPQGGGDHYAKIKTLLAADSEQDVMYMATHAGYMEVFALGAFLDLTGLIKQDRGFDSKAALYPQADHMTRVKGQVVGVPVDTGGYVIFFNKDALARAGLPAPRDGWTLADFERAAKLTTTGDGAAKQWGYRTQTGRMDSWIWSNGGDYYDRNVNPTRCLLAQPAAVEACQQQADMVFRQQAAPTPVDLSGSAPTLQNGRVALYVEGPWNIATMRKTEVAWDVAPVPRWKQQATMLQVEILTLSRRTKAPDAAWAFVKHMFSDDGQRRVIEISGRMPATPDHTRRLFVPWAKDQGVSSPEAFVDLFKYGRLRALPVRADEIGRLLTPALTSILNDGVPAKAALEPVVPQIDDILKNSPQV
jgi:multiple sugar transport system substrate-binding protein